MKPYPTYKPSGTPWLGLVPSHWQVRRLKFNFRIVNGGTPDSGEASYWDGGVVWITPSDLGKLETVEIVSSGRCLTNEGFESCGGALVPVGSIVLSTRAPIGHVAIANTPLCTNQGCRALVLQEADVPHYHYYLLSLAKAELQSLGRGTTFLELSTSSLGNVEVCRPPIDEQQGIADFLDVEVERIDGLIREKLGLVALLDEARSSFVSTLLSGDATEGSPTDNKWAPHLPHGWQMKRLKHLAQIRSGIAKGKDSEGKLMVEMPYLRVANVQDGHLDLDEVSTIEVEVSAVERYSLKHGDVLMNEGGDYDKLGRGALWSGEVSPCLHQNHVFAVRPIEEDLSEWIAAITQTKYAKFYFMNNAKQSTNLASISQKNVKELPVLLPPKKVREELLAKAKGEAKAIAELVAHTRDEIALLKELRAATIADAVLGRVDVRTRIASPV